MSIRGSGASFDTIYISDQQFRLMMVCQRTNVWASMWFTCIITLTHQTKLTRHFLLKSLYQATMLGSNVYMCQVYRLFICFYNRLGFVFVPTVVYLFLHYIANDTSEINTSVTRFGIIKQCSDYNYKSLCTRVNWLCFTSCKSAMCNEAPVRILHQ